MKKRTYQIVSTRNYEKLNFVPINRKVYESNKKKIRQSMEEFGYDPSMPMILWEDTRGIYGKVGQLYILDGQHRYEVAFELGEDIFYTIRKFRNEDLLSDDELKKLIRRYITRIVNNNSKKWGADDNIDSFVKEGHPFYVNLNKLVKSTGLTNTHIVKFLTGDPRATTTTIRNHGENLKQGDPKFTNECLDLTRKIREFFPYVVNWEMALPITLFVKNHINDPMWEKYKNTLISTAKRGKMSYQTTQELWIKKLEEWAKIPLHKLYR